MGSLPDGTMCAYCDQHEAGYIPDGCCGPVCGPCLDNMLGGGRLELIRYSRWLRSHIAWFTSFKHSESSIAEVVFRDTDLCLRIAEFSIHA